MTQEDKFDKFVSSLESRFVPSEETVSSVISSIRASMKVYVEWHNLQSLVIGLYSDLDSTVVAALCQEKYTGVPLLGIVMEPDARINPSHWAGFNLCTSYKSLNSIGYIDKEISSFMYEAWEEFKEFNSVSSPTMPDIHSALLRCLAQQTNGILLGNKTWSDMFATLLYQEGEADYFPLEGINKGYELPALAKHLEIPQYIIDSSNTNEAKIGATYREIDVIINGHLGRLDDNLTTQFNRYKDLEKVQRVLLRFKFNSKFRELADKRADLNLPTTYRY